MAHIADAFIGCRLGEMYLPRGNSFKQVSLYPPTKAITKLQDETWFDKEPSDGKAPNQFSLLTR